MPGQWFYDAIYRVRAPWEVGVRRELEALVGGGTLAPSPGARAIDLGCGSGANTIFVAQHGWETTGVDFSPVALRKARKKAAAAGAPSSLRFVVGDLTAEAIEGVAGPFDLLVDYGTLDDLDAAGRTRMAALATRLAAPGATLLLWCFFGRPEDLPFISFIGPSKLAAAIAPGELERLFGESWEVRRLPEPGPATNTACFLLTRRAAPP